MDFMLADRLRRGGDPTLYNAEENDMGDETQSPIYLQPSMIPGMQSYINPGAQVYVDPEVQTYVDPEVQSYIQPKAQSHITPEVEPSPEMGPYAKPEMDLPLRSPFNKQGFAFGPPGDSSSPEPFEQSTTIPLTESMYAFAGNVGSSPMRSAFDPTPADFNVQMNLADERTASTTINPVMFQVGPSRRQSCAPSREQTPPLQSTNSPQTLHYPHVQSLEQQRLPSRLHIWTNTNKSRVETQINVLLTLENPPPGIEWLHLPLHTIAKSKLLARSHYESSKTIQLQTNLVCTSAMRNPDLRAKALKRAAEQSNEYVQWRSHCSKQHSALAQLENRVKEPMKNVPEEDKPANGGEVRICANCLQRERKRAGRKKARCEEEQQHWEQFESERVVVFNSNEYQTFRKPGVFEKESSSSRPHSSDSNYTPPDGALQVCLAMRIACYCRHQSEKEGFQVILTVKDRMGNIVAQQLTPSILITDDHKTNPTNAVTVSAEIAPNYGVRMPSQSMHNLQQAVAPGIHPFSSSRSAGDLQALSWAATPQSIPPQFASQPVSARATPPPQSRPGSPMGIDGPNKRRRSCSSHRPMLQSLDMTRAMQMQAFPFAANIPTYSMAGDSGRAPQRFSNGGIGLGRVAGGIATMPTTPLYYHPPTFVPQQINHHMSNSAGSPMVDIFPSLTNGEHMMPFANPLGQ
ncbi:hypothetical protein K470DRAFT_172438 [Piedraia hortae CBS 480.64]|uniref:SPT23/MGA2-like DNA-binding domain-containing protein n=1 Tax=Piedraia hortae CBS 480.64 TaxID=1314780 RepID=A0A6A7BQ48_9PEZI|nr:hypothetical protein K470DRAFT_172438 [Piedraia hortae CBS 480.64]